MSKKIDEHLKLAHLVIDIVDGPYRKICVTLLPYNVDKPGSSYAQVRFFARMKTGQKVWKFPNVKYKLEEFIYLHDKIKSVYDEAITNKPNCFIQQKVSATIYKDIYFISVFILLESE